MNLLTQVPYTPTVDIETIRLATNAKHTSQDLLESIQYSTDPALLSLVQYIQFVSQESLLHTPTVESKCPYTNAKQKIFDLLGIATVTKNSKDALCPFIRGMNKKELHYAMLYDDNKLLDFDAFYKKCFDKLDIIKSTNKNKLATFYGIFSDPELDTQEFSDALQMYCMRRKSEVVASGHMAGAMLSRHRPGGAERIFNKDTFSTKANNFKTEGFSYIAFRKLHFDDFGSMRTPENMQAFMQHFPGAAYQLRYIPQFIQFLQDKIEQDKADFAFLDQMDPASIMMHYYEHHLMQYSAEEIDRLQNLFAHDFEMARRQLEQIVLNTEIRYRRYIDELQTINQQLGLATQFLSPHP